MKYYEPSENGQFPGLIKCLLEPGSACSVFSLLIVCENEMQDINQRADPLLRSYGAQHLLERSPPSNIDTLTLYISYQAHLRSRGHIGPGSHQAYRNSQN